MRWHPRTELNVRWRAVLCYEFGPSDNANISALLELRKYSIDIVGQRNRLIGSRF